MMNDDPAIWRGIGMAVVFLVAFYFAWRATREKEGGGPDAPVCKICGLALTNGRCPIHWFLDQDV